MPSWVDFVRRTPCLVLLVVQLGGVLLYPAMDSTTGRSVFALFGLLVLALTVLALRATPYLTWVAALVAFPSAVLLVISVFTAEPDLFVWSAAFEMVLYFYAAVSMLAYMLHDEHVTTDEMFAIPAVFPCWHGRSRTCTWWCRHSIRVVSTRTVWATGPGWSSCSSPSRRSPAPASRTSHRSRVTHEVWS